LSVALFGESLAIRDFPHRPELAGAGMSDWDGYASRLTRKLGYTNTYYHKDPHLDITSIGPGESDRYDFLISSDVFEHVCAPVSRALENSYRILKRGGVMVLTVPYRDGQTQEHFPEVRQFTVRKDGAGFVLVGSTQDGEIRKYTDLTFHGGPGTTVECRIFGKDGLMRACKDAGFQSVKIHDEPVEKFGIIWSERDTDDARHTRGIVGLNAPPWVLVKR
jgi:SAM-dependent methyltransferase